MIRVGTANLTQKRLARKLGFHQFDDLIGAFDTKHVTDANNYKCFIVNKTTPFIY